MPERTYTHHLATPRVEKGGEAPLVGCYESPWAYDVLADGRAGRERDEAFLAARSMCQSCPVQQTCWENSADEDWLIDLADLSMHRVCGYRKCNNEFLLHTKNPHRIYCSALCGSRANYEEAVKVEPVVPEQRLNWKGKPRSAA